MLPLDLANPFIQAMDLKRIGSVFHHFHLLSNQTRPASASPSKTDRRIFFTDSGIAFVPFKNCVGFVGFFSQMPALKITEPEI